MNWYLKVIRDYVNFEGRARRQEYWMFVLINMGIAIVLAVIDFVLGTYPIFYGIYGLAVLLPSLSVAVRRLHDINKNGWMVCIALIPFVGAIWLLILLCTEGDRSNNQYGPNPKLAS